MTLFGLPANHPHDFLFGGLAACGFICEARAQKDILRLHILSSRISCGRSHPVRDYRGA